MNLAARIEWASRLGEHLVSNHPNWLDAKDRAYRLNPWFIPEFIDLATHQIAHSFLEKELLEKWVNGANIPDQPAMPARIGLVLAGNLPLVGFHDWLCVFISGHHGHLKLSAQDAVLFEYIRELLVGWEPQLAPYLQVADRLNGLDAYIATGSNNTARYFEYYFGKYPHIIRKNRTSIAVLGGNETATELINLSNDLYPYFGRGCRNVTHLFVPRGYDFQPLLEAGSNYSYLSDQNKYKNNYDYQLALRILNKEYYMTNQIGLFVEQPALHAPISVIHYTYYDRIEEVETFVSQEAEQIQCRVGLGGYPFGATQKPDLGDYADGVNTLDFLRSLS